VHEIGYCEGVVEAVVRRAAGRPVARIGVRIGALHRIVPDAFAQSFQLVAGGTSAEDAVTELVVVPAQATCRGCGAVFETPDPSAVCPDCGDLDVTVTGGDEVVLEWVEYADAAAPEQPDERVPAHTHQHSPAGGR
jgi:hydrogenase nickel incorporation protein HypA/HybF